MSSSDVHAHWTTVPVEQRKDKAINEIRCNFPDCGRTYRNVRGSGLANARLHTSHDHPGAGLAPPARKEKAPDAEPAGMMKQSRIKLGPPRMTREDAYFEVAAAFASRGQPPSMLQSMGPHYSGYRQALMKLDRPPCPKTIRKAQKCACVIINPSHQPPLPPIIIEPHLPLPRHVTQG